MLLQITRLALILTVLISVTLPVSRLFSQNSAGTHQDKDGVPLSSGLEDDYQLLLASNKALRSAHLENNSENLASEFAEEFCEIKNGSIQMVKRKDLLEKFANYFSNIKYYKWDDLEEPLISISPDGNLASVAVQKIAIARQAHSSPNSTSGATLFAWIANYQKSDDHWEIYQIATTREEYEYSDPRLYVKRGQEKLMAGQHQEALVDFKKAYNLRRESPEIAIHYAHTLALCGKKQMAIEVLKDVARTGFQGICEIAKEGWFRALGGNKGFEQLQLQIEEVGAWTNNAKWFTKISERDLVPEGLAVDNKTGNIYVSSLRKRKIIEVARSGEIHDFISPKQDGIFGTLGMEVDEHRRHLWVVSCSGPKMIDGEMHPAFKSQVYQYDIDSKRLLQKIELESDQQVLLNDLAIADNGDVFVSETLGAAIYKIGFGEHNLVRLYKDNWGHRYFNGIALSSDQKLIYLAHSEGVIRVDAETGSYVGRLGHPKQMALGNIDGMTYWNGNLICHQSTQFGGIEMYKLDHSGSQVIERVSLERNHPSFDQATTGGVLGDSYVFIANSQMRSAFRDGKIKPLKELDSILLLEVSLK